MYVSGYRKIGDTLCEDQLIKQLIHDREQKQIEEAVKFYALSVIQQTEQIKEDCNKLNKSFIPNDWQSAYDELFNI